jgi:hypothetical protein
MIRYRLDGSIELVDDADPGRAQLLGPDADVAAACAAFFPPPPPPQSVTPRQLHLALIEAGIYDQVTALVDASDARTRAAWHYAIAYDRTDPMLIGAATALGMSAADIDALFGAAAAL